MSKIVALKNLIKDTRGATLVEYIMLAGLVALICIAAFTAFGSTISSKVHNQVTTVGNINTGTGSLSLPSPEGLSEARLLGPYAAPRSRLVCYVGSW